MSQKSTPGQLHPAGFAVLRDHTWIVWRQPWAPSHAFGPIPLSRLTVKSPCRERSTKRTFTFTFTSLSVYSARLTEFTEVYPYPAGLVSGWEISIYTTCCQKHSTENSILTLSEKQFGRFLQRVQLLYCTFGCTNKSQNRK